MKTVLILAYDFPPYNSIAAQRPGSWFHYFKQNNMYPVVVTRHWDREIKTHADYYKPSLSKVVEQRESEDGTVISVPFIPTLRDRILDKYGIGKFVLIRKILSLVQIFTRYLSFRFDNTANIFYEADDYLSKNKCDYIIATGEPFILFRYAALLAKKHKLKWVADYRDCWSSDNSDFSNPLFNRLIFNQFFKRMEKRIVKSATFITTAAPAYKDSIKSLFPNQKVHVIYNGYDNDTFDRLKEVGQGHDEFEIAYPGTIYLNQNLEMFLEGFKLFVQENSEAKIKLIFYGLDFFPQQKHRLLHFDEALNKYITTTQKIRYVEVLENIQKAHLLLLLSSRGFNKLAGKVFDYLPINRKILLVENDHGILEKIVDECHGGVKCDTENEVKEYLCQFYNEYMDTKKIVHQSYGYEKYSRKIQAEKFVQLFNDL